MHAVFYHLSSALVTPFLETANTLFIWYLQGRTSLLQQLLFLESLLDLVEAVLSTERFVTLSLLFECLKVCLVRLV